MILRSYLKSSLLLIATSSFAFANEKVTCPSFNTIQKTWQHIDSASKLGNYYAVGTLKDVFTENNIPWTVGAYGISTKSASEAVQIGKEMVRNTGYSKTVLAMQPDQSANVFICLYGPSDIYAIGGNDFNLSVMKFLS